MMNTTTTTTTSYNIYNDTTSPSARILFIAHLHLTRTSVLTAQHQLSMACAGDCAVSSKVAVGVKERRIISGQCEDSKETNKK